MKNTVFILILAILASCGGNTSNNSKSNYADITISMDTVVVDSGDEILMAATSSDLIINENVDKLYFWDIQSSKIEIIDLNALKLLEKKPFEREGPNGVGQYPYEAKLITENKIGFIEWRQVSIADMNGKVIQRIKLDEEWMKEHLNEKESLTVLGFSESGDLMYCAMNNFFSDLNSNILEVDLINQTTRLIELPDYAKRENFRVTYKQEQGEFFEISANEPSLEMTHHKDHILFWSDAFNAIYKYDPEADSLTYHKITNTLFANEKSGTYKNDVTTNEERLEMATKLREEVAFSSLFWDDKNSVFYRFTSFNLPRVADEKIKSRVFLSIINEEFEVIGEKEITGIVGKVPTAQFVKDGLIYSHLNVDDELGFIRIGINQ